MLKHVLVGTLAIVVSSCAGQSSGPGGARVTCKDAALTLPDDAVVATFNGKSVTYKELGADAKRAEDRALRSYCDAVYQTRSVALDNLITEQLVDAEAKKESKSTEDWIRAQVDAKVGEPDDAAVQSFYDKQKAQMGDQLPPLEMVRPQVVAFLKRESSETAVADIIDGLKKQAKVDKKLPDVRSPPVDLKAAAHTGVKGNKGGKIRVVEFADFQCPYCTRAAETMAQLAAKYGDKVEFSYRHFPLRQIHPEAQRAAEISQCAGEQGKFWEVHDALYANQNALDEQSAIDHASKTGVDAQKLKECLSSGRAAAQVDADFKLGEESGVEGTPSFFINGRKFEGNPTVGGLSQALDDALRL